MSYFKTRIRQLRQEYRKKDRDAIIAAAGKCQMCERKDGDVFLFGPTHYLKKKIRFTVRLDIHVLDSTGGPKSYIVICDGCHCSYHLFNRLSEAAEFGTKKLSDTLYKRCSSCRELSCMCCKNCEMPKKWCSCKRKKRAKAAKATKKDYKALASLAKKLRLRRRK